MNFRNPQSTPTPKKVKDDGATLKKEIQGLGEYHEKILNEIKEAEKSVLMIKDKKPKLKKFIGQIELKQNKLSDIDADITSKEQDIISLVENHAKKVSDLNDEYYAAKEKLQDETSFIEKETIAGRNKLSSFNVEIDSAKSATNDALKELDIVRADLFQSKKDLVEVNKIAKNIIDSRKKIDALESKIKQLTIKKLDLDIAVVKLETTVSKLEKRADVAETKSKEFADIIDEDRKAFNEQMRIRREEADVRDGEISKKESWVKDKTKELRKAKDELEKFYNRPITHIIL